MVFTLSPRSGNEALNFLATPVGSFQNGYKHTFEVSVTGGNIESFKKLSVKMNVAPARNGHFITPCIERFLKSVTLSVCGGTKIIEWDRNAIHVASSIGLIKYDGDSNHIYQGSSSIYKDTTADLAYKEITQLSPSSHPGLVYESDKKRGETGGTYTIADNGSALDLGSYAVGPRTAAASNGGNASAYGQYHCKHTAGTSTSQNSIHVPPLYRLLSSNVSGVAYVRTEFGNGYNVNREVTYKMPVSRSTASSSGEPDWKESPWPNPSIESLSRSTDHPGRPAGDWPLGGQFAHSFPEGDKPGFTDYKNLSDKEQLQPQNGVRTVNIVIDLSALAFLTGITALQTGTPNKGVLLSGGGEKLKLDIVTGSSDEMYDLPFYLTDTNNNPGTSSADATDLSVLIDKNLPNIVGGDNRNNVLSDPTSTGKRLFAFPASRTKAAKNSDFICGVDAATANNKFLVQSTLSIITDRWVPSGATDTFDSVAGSAEMNILNIFHESTTAVNANAQELKLNQIGSTCATKVYTWVGFFRSDNDLSGSVGPYLTNAYAAAGALAETVPLTNPVPSGMSATHRAHMGNAPYQIDHCVAALDNRIAAGVAGASWLNSQLNFNTNIEKAWDDTLGNVTLTIKSFQGGQTIYDNESLSVIHSKEYEGAPSISNDLKRTGLIFLPCHVHNKQLVATAPATATRSAARPLDLFHGLSVAEVAEISIQNDSWTWCGDSVVVTATDDALGGSVPAPGGCDSKCSRIISVTLANLDTSFISKTVATYFEVFGLGVTKYAYPSGCMVQSYSGVC